MVNYNITIVISIELEHADKVSYAQKMARGYLRSVGSGEFTPQKSRYYRDSQTSPEPGKPARWRQKDSDEFDF